jgi:RecA-family ATPase
MSRIELPFEQLDGLPPELLRLYEAAGAIETDPATGRSRKTASALEQLGAIDPATLAEVEPPPRKWLIDQWLPIGVVTSLYGAGGVGKSLLAMQAATAVATGTSFFGRATVQASVLAVFCEDDRDELHRRQNAINRANGVKLGDGSALRLVARTGESNFLVVHDAEQRQSPTELFALVERAALELGARLIVLDNIAQLFPGNENDRMQVTNFLNLLTALARQIDGAVLLLGHPAKSEGSAYSGSTAWDAAVRSRWLLKRPRTDDGAVDDPASAFERELHREKSNYSGTGDVVALRWVEGAFVRVGDVRQSAAEDVENDISTSRPKRCETAFLSVLDELHEAGVTVSPSPRSRNYAPRTMKRAKALRAFRLAEIGAAMNRLIQSEAIIPDLPLRRRANRTLVRGIGRPEWALPSAPLAAREQADRCTTVKATVVQATC